MIPRNLIIKALVPPSPKLIGTKSGMKCLSRKLQPIISRSIAQRQVTRRECDAEDVGKLIGWPKRVEGEKASRSSCMSE